MGREGIEGYGDKIGGRVEDRLGGPSDSTIQRVLWVAGVL